MKKKIEDKKKIAEYLKKQKELIIEYNIYPMIKIDLVNKQMDFNFYELDKLTEDERKGTLFYPK